MSTQTLLFAKVHFLKSPINALEKITTQTVTHHLKYHIWRHLRTKMNPP